MQITPNPELPLNTIASGEIVLQSGGTNEFEVGIQGQSEVRSLPRLVRRAWSRAEA